MLASVAALLSLATMSIVGCSSSGPKLAGFAIGDTRIVSVGEIVELRAPLSDDRSPLWRVESFDSLYLSMVGRPQVTSDGKGGFILVTRARAETPGETSIKLVESGRFDGPPRSVSFTVRIVE